MRGIDRSEGDQGTRQPNEQSGARARLRAGVEGVPDTIYRQFAELAARALATPIAFLSLPEGDHLRFRGCRGWPLDRLPRAGNAPLAPHEPLCIGDTRAQPELRDAVFVAGSPHVRFLATAPIRANGAIIGAVCVADVAPRPALAAGQLAHLVEIATLAALTIGCVGDAQARLTDFVETSSDWLWETDSEHRFSHFTQLHGLFASSPPTSFMGRCRWELAGADPLDPRWIGHRADLDAHRPFRNFEYTTADAEGRLHRLRVSGKPIFGDDGRFLGYRGTASDVTAQREAEAVARDRDRLFQRIVESTTEGVWVCDADGCTTYANDRMAAILGRPRHEIVGRPFLDLLDGSALEAWNRRKRGIAEQHEVLLSRPDGSAVWTLMHSNPIFDAAGRFAGALSMVIDITERRRTVEQLHQSEAQFRYLFEKNPNPMWVYEDGTLRFLAVNEAAIALYGYSREEFLSMTILDIRTPEEAARVLEMIADFPRTGVWYSGVWRHRAKDGRSIDVEIVSDDMVYEGRQAYIVAVRDVSERLHAEGALRESEARFRQIADSVPGILWIIDEEGRFTFLSKTFEQYTGEPAEQHYGRTTTGRAHPDDGRSVGPEFAAAFRERRPLAYEYRVRRHDGVYRWFLDTCIPRFDDSGRFLGYIGMLTDVEDRRTLAEQLHQAQKMQAVGQLTGGIAHDFNNLLTVILGNVEMLAEQLSDPRLRRLAESTQDAAERSAALVQRLLAFSRRQALQPMALDVATLVQDMRDLMQRSLGEHIDIRFAVAPDLWRVTADRSQLEAALLNLAVNARDAMPSGGRLTIDMANAEIDRSYVASEPDVVPGAYVMIAVSDSGTGMDEETRRHAFEPFFTTKDVGKGSGLGLSMVYGFIKQSGGHVTLYSEIGQGTTVKMYLPRAVGPAAKSAAHVADPSPASGRETILVVEDDAHVRAYVVEQLNGLGYRVLEAANGIEALSVLERHPAIDLLFTDVVMPGHMNGRDLADQARRRHPSLKVLFTTGYTESAIVHQGRLDPGVELLGKPFSRAALAAKIRAVLDSRA